MRTVITLDLPEGYQVKNIEIKKGSDVRHLKFEIITRPTDEEIDKHYPLGDGKRIAFAGIVTARRQGARYMRDQIFGKEQK